jgi:nitrogen fixation NifU-like protein
VSDLRELYQEVILDHNHRPRNQGELPDANAVAEGHNPLCGDQLTLYLKVEDGKIADIRFQGCGCAISTASASLMTEAVKGKSVEEVREIFQRFHALVTGEAEGQEFFDEFDSLMALAGVKEFPVRVKCATLAWHTLQQALEGGGVASTE